MRELLLSEVKSVHGGQVSEVVVVGSNNFSYSLGGLDVMGLGWGGSSFWQNEPHVDGDTIIIDLSDYTPPSNPSYTPIDPATTPTGSTSDLDEIVVTAVEWHTEWIDLGEIQQSIYIPEIVACDPGLVDTLDINWILPGAHNYAVVDKVSSNPGDMAKAWAGLLNYAAPGQNGVAWTGNIVSTPFGPVMQTVDAQHYTITNTTQAGHMLAPGDVQRSVLQGADGVYILTVGTGEGWLGDVNRIMSPLMWGKMDDSITQYIVNH